jgi:hypothetical protein
VDILNEHDQMANTFQAICVSYEQVDDKPASWTYFDNACGCVVT